MRNRSGEFDYLIAVTGASGSVYAHRLIEELLARNYRLGLIFSSAGQQVFAYEMRLSASEDWADFLRQFYAASNLRVFSNQQFFVSPASGSNIAKAMIVIPASMGTVSRIANGNSASLLERAADVYLKESQPLLLVPRETPLNAIHLENLLRLQRMGVKIIAAMPGFYNHPANIADLVNFVVGKVLDALEIEHTLYAPWEGGA